MSRFHFFLLTVFAVALNTSPVQAEDYPEATTTANPNVVTSPYPPNKKVDVTGFLPGDLARDPHTNKVFRIPARKATPLVFKPEVIEDAPPTTRDPGTANPSVPEVDDLPVRRPEIVEDTPPSRSGAGDTSPASVAEVIATPESGNPEILAPPVVEPQLPEFPVRAPRSIDDPLTEFVKVFIRSGQNDDPMAQAKFLAANLSSYYALPEATKDQVIAKRRIQIAQWPRRIYVVSGKPRFVRWINPESDENEFVIDVRVYQSMKNTSGTTKRGYADHRLTIRETTDGSFEITGTEERHPRSVLAGQ